MVIAAYRLTVLLGHARNGGHLLGDLGYRTDVVLDVRQIKVALARLRELTREGSQEELDVDATVDST